MKNILVTGSSGTIGTRLCEKLLAEGYNVYGIDWKENVWDKEVAKRTIRADLRSRDFFTKVPKNVDGIIHLAANARVYNLVRDPTLARDNFETLFNVLEFARTANVKRFIFASSREVYGNSMKIIHHEDEAYVKNCESPYTASKIGGEALVHSYEQCYGLNFVIVRFSNVYGMYDGSDRLIPLYLERARKNEDLIVYGEDKLLDFTYIDDAVYGVMTIIARFERVKNKIFNLAYGQGVSILEVAQLVKEMLGSRSKIVIKENRTGEVVKYIADISHARDHLEYCPKVTIVEGIKKSVAWYEKHYFAQPRSQRAVEKRTYVRRYPIRSRNNVRV